MKHNNLTITIDGENLDILAKYLLDHQNKLHDLKITDPIYNRMLANWGHYQMILNRLGLQIIFIPDESKLKTYSDAYITIKA